MSQPYLGEIRLFPGHFPPRTNALCAGQLLSIAQNTALFSLLGTFYGGNGTTNFALPICAAACRSTRATVRASHRALLASRLARKP